MNNKDNKNIRVSTGGIGFSGLLSIVFIALKLTGVINWSWVWILAPMWIELSVAIVGVVIIFILHHNEIREIRKSFHKGNKNG